PRDRSTRGRGELSAPADVVEGGERLDLVRADRQHALAVGLKDAERRAQGEARYEAHHRHLGVGGEVRSLQQLGTDQILRGKDGRLLVALRVHRRSIASQQNDRCPYRELPSHWMSSAVMLRGS